MKALRQSLLLCLLCLPCAFGGDELGARRQYLELARQFELKPTETPPDWAMRTDPPLAKLAWFTDLHLNAAYLPLAHRALAYINGLKPQAVLVTGDNCAYAPADFRPELTDRNVRRTAYFQHLLADELTAPAAVIPGDNWPWAYDKVFGPRQFSFDLAGVHVICLATDCAAKGIEGCAVFDETTWTWLKADLERNAAKPTLLTLHENLAPPTFLDAGPLASLLESQPQVLATLTGHLHLDVEFRVGHLQHIVCPALGPSLRHGLKMVSIYPDAILLQTHEQGETGETFHPVNICQRIEIPAAYRAGLAAEPMPYRLARQSETPTRPKVENPALRDRSPELFAPAMGFLLGQGVSSLPSLWHKPTP